MAATKSPPVSGLPAASGSSTRSGLPPGSGSRADAVFIVLEGSMVVGGLAQVQGIFESKSVVKLYCYAPCRGYLSPGFGSGQTRSLDGRGFSEQVAALTHLSHPGFQSRTEGSSRGATARRAERREATSAVWAVFHGDDIR